MLFNGLFGIRAKYTQIVQAAPRLQYKVWSCHQGKCSKGRSFAPQNVDKGQKWMSAYSPKGLSHFQDKRTPFSYIYLEGQDSLSKKVLG
jgi:hypothetical protein